jgi:hypothetical protein
MLNGSATPAEVGTAYVRFLRNELLPYGRTISVLTVDYYRGLAAAARDYSEAFSEELLGSGTVHREEDAEGRVTERPAVTLTGEIGSKAAVSFSLENHDPEPADVTLKVGLARAPDGSAFTAPLTVEPASMTIPPRGGHKTVTVKADLNRQAFQPDVAYRLPLHVEGPRPATVDITILATEIPLE